jgi:hypothetical protein
LPTTLEAKGVQAADTRNHLGGRPCRADAVRGALDNPRCQGGLKGPRWLTDFQAHYNWCLVASYAAIGSERDARTAYLLACR